MNGRMGVAKRKIGGIAAILLLPAILPAQQKPSAPGQTQANAPTISADLQKQMEEQRKASQPGPEHLNLMRLEGDYKTKEMFYLPGAAEPMESDGVASLRSEMGGRFIVEHNHGGYLGEPYSGLRIYGYNNGTKHYEGVWTWTGSTAIMPLVGDSKDGGRTIQYAATSYDDSSGQLRRMNVTLQMLDTDHFQVELRSTMPDGSPGPRLVSLYSRTILPPGH